MSTRDFMIAVKSIDSLRNVVGSNDEALFNDILAIAKEKIEDEFGSEDEMDEDDLDDYREGLESTKTELRQMILTNPPPKSEPGSWIFLIKEIVANKGLQIKVRLSFNKGYKHAYTWQPYRKLVESRLSEAAAAALQHLENGRSLKGQSIDYDGSLFGWLTLAEVIALHNSLSAISAADVGNCDLEEFHQDLVDALAAVKEQKCDLVLGAH